MNTLDAYRERVIRNRVTSNAAPAPRGSYRSFTVAASVSVTIHVTWFKGSGWYFSVEVWDLSKLQAADETIKVFYLTRDIDSPERQKHWSGHAFWECVAAGEEHARKLISLFGGQFPGPLNPYSRCDGDFGN